MRLGGRREQHRRWFVQHHAYGKLALALLVLLAVTAAWAVTDSFTITVNVSDVPGPSQALFSAPYYTCSTNRYVSTTGSDSNDGTASDNAHAWLTIAHANSVTPSAGWCVNVLPGTYANGATVTHGGNLASSTGYVVYRCTTLNGCTITDTGSNAFNSAFGIQTNYIWFDGFVLNGGNGTNAFTLGFGTCNASSPACAGDNSFGFHHIWVTNSIVHGYGQAGIDYADGDYWYTIHSTFYDNAHDCNLGAQGSNISYFLPIKLSPYTPTADDANNPITGNTGTKFRQFIMWNVLYNAYICSASTVGVSDGNGIILDDWLGDQFITPTGTVQYVAGGLIAFNVSYNNGGGNIHAFNSPYVTIANNSAFNNNLQLGNTGQGFRGGIDDDGSYGNNYINNISYTGCGSGAQANNSAMGIYGIDGGTNYVAATTLSAGVTTTGQTSVSLTSIVKFPNGSTFNSSGFLYNADYTLPGGNMILIDSEIMRVTAGWGTSTLTVTRGFNGTTAATHSSGAAVNWLQSYYSNNITHTTSTCTEIDIGQGSSANTFYSSTQNKEATLPGWVNVGNTTFGTDSTQPNGSNFALSGGAAAIGYGSRASPFDFLPASAVDAGACNSALTICP